MPIPRTTCFLTLALLCSIARAQSLDSRINAILANPQLKTASVSLDITEITPRGPVPLFSHDATLPLGPASNCKLLTTSAAFEKYGPAATFKTFLYQVGPDLLLVGGGDPGLGDAKICAAAGTTPTAAFEQWAATLKKAGITQYRDLIVDDRIFDSQWTHPNWPADQTLDWYAAPIAGLNFNANCLDWTPKLTPQGVALELMPPTSYVSITIKATKGPATKVSLLRPANSNKFELRGTVASSGSTPYSVPIYDPGLWTGTILADTLAHAGISASGHIRRPQADERFPQGTLLATHETPLLAVLERANTNSLNMMAECLCKRLGYDATGKPGSWANGTAAVEAYAASLGVRPEWVSLDDGSGLSNKNKVAARAFTTVLAHVAARPDGNQFLATLAVPGDDGTLIRRFKGLSVAPHVQAKTGHITGVSALSGYILLPTRRFAFSILVNKYQGNVNPLQDQICQALYDWANGK
jgi:D-alanyl-D-alanine carboxypeptidase/D-alanyl-D-alanine-endopeptidase (penicillin-binding protein 4)